MEQPTEWSKRLKTNDIVLVNALRQTGTIVGLMYRNQKHIHYLYLIQVGDKQRLCFRSELTKVEKEKQNEYRNPVW